MQNALGDAADAVLLTAAKILDTLTYRLSDIATDTSVPNNNDTLVAPLTEKLATDLAKFNHVLDDYSLDVVNCRHLIESFRIKNEKEKVIKQEQEEQRLKEQQAKEEADLRAQQQIQQQQNQQKEEVNLDPAPQLNNADDDLGLDLTNDNDDLMLDLDLDNFKFDSAAGDAMNFNFDDSKDLSFEAKAQQQQQSQQSQQSPPLQQQPQQSPHQQPQQSPQQQQLQQSPQQLQPPQQSQQSPQHQQLQQEQQLQQQPLPQPQSQQPLPQSTSQSTNNATAGSEDYLNFGQDEELADLDLNFLEEGEMNELLGSNQGNDLNVNLDSGKPEDMEQLFSQFDEMVGNNNNL